MDDTCVCSDPLHFHGACRCGCTICERDDGTDTSPTRTGDLTPRHNPANAYTGIYYSQGTYHP